MLQKEAIRASQRRPKNVVLPEKENSPKKSGKEEGKQHLEGNKGREQHFSRVGNIRRSFGRIRNKFAADQRQKQNKKSESFSGIGRRGREGLLLNYYLVLFHAYKYNILY